MFRKNYIKRKITGGDVMNKIKLNDSYEILVAGSNMGETEDHHRRLF